MKNVKGRSKQRPALRIIKRMVKHSKTYEELQDLWELAMELLTNDERPIFYICVFCAYQWSLPKERELYV